MATITVCDYCRKEFGYPGRANEKYDLILNGGSHTDAAGQGGQRNQIRLELHQDCVQKLFDKLQNYQANRL